MSSFIPPSLVTVDASNSTDAEVAATGQSTDTSRRLRNDGSG
jgi:hypothetical protein